MNRILAWIRSFFGFSRTETNGFLILLPLLLIVLFFEPVYQAWFTNQPQDHSNDVILLDSITSNWEYPKNKVSDSAIRVTTEFTSFKFNPNTATDVELSQLGFAKSIVIRIINFRTKGGRFRIKSDLKKIYGIDSLFVISLYPLITLPEKIEKVKKEESKQLASLVKKKLIDINIADTAQLIRLRGIGSKLSLRIIKYRDRLGGFVSQKQFIEVYGLDSLVIEELKKNSYIVVDFVPRQINLNKASEKEFAVLPYIKFSVAKAIVAYRFQHGSFSTVDELRKIALVDERLFQKCMPYLTVKE